MATMLRRKTNRITVILVHAVLEWILIILLLLNSLFGYLIAKFADHFGLKPPCSWCSSGSVSCKINMCEAHAAEISRLGYCLNHRKLAESESMCMDCLASSPSQEHMRIETTSGICFISWVNKERDEDGRKALRCSCCNGSLRSDLYPPYWMLESTWGATLKSNPKGGHVVTEIFRLIGLAANAEIERNDEQDLLEDVDAQAPALEDATLQHNQERTNPDEVNRTVPRKEEQEVVDIEGMMEDMVGQVCKQVITLKVSRALSNYFGGDEESTKSDYPSAEPEDVAEEETLSADQTESTELKPGSQKPIQQQNPSSSTSVTVDGSPLSSHACIPLKKEIGQKLEEETNTTTECTSVDKIGARSIHHAVLHSDPNEADEEKLPEESIDGSVVSESEGGDPVLTIERLKTALKAERRALSALYSELEEERSASAIAANQTMAMINRLQEEKAAVQMEALQYQRMMEEQSQYDQEALQLLNELMIKREKEKHELEEELEAYRNGDSDSETKGGQESIHDFVDDEVTNLQEVALDCVKQMTALDDSLAEYEDERLSILDQLKTLEEKLLNLKSNDNAEEANSQYIVDKLDTSYELDMTKEDGMSRNMQKLGLYPERKTMGSMAKSLLPLLDEALDDDVEKLTFEGRTSASEVLAGACSPLSPYELDSELITADEAVDHMYERLQALEADREFMKHCMSSIQKGDKGMDLLQEVLQHLRDLKAVELDIRDMTHDPLEHSYSS